MDIKPFDYHRAVLDYKTRAILNFVVMILFVAGLGFVCAVLLQIYS